MGIPKTHRLLSQLQLFTLLEEPLYPRSFLTQSEMTRALFVPFPFDRNHFAHGSSPSFLQIGPREVVAVCNSLNCAGICFKESNCYS